MNKTTSAAPVIPQSANQEFPIENPTIPDQDYSEKKPSTILRKGQSSDSDVSDTENVINPYFKEVNSNFIRDIRDSNRKLRESVDDNDFQEKINEKNILTDKKFLDGLTAEEERRLHRLQWEISAIDYAKNYDSIDSLEKLVIMQEDLKKDLSDFLSIFRNKSVNKKHRGRK